jgi:hypothetical protein
VLFSSQDLNPTPQVGLVPNIGTCPNSSGLLGIVLLIHARLGSLRSAVSDDISPVSRLRLDKDNFPVNAG